MQRFLIALALVSMCGCSDQLGSLEDGEQGESSLLAAPADAAVKAITVPIAINGPRTGASPGFQGDFLSMTGSVQSAVFQLAGVPVGSTITAARVRVRDNATGPTRLNAVLYPSVDGNQRAAIATSSMSAGTGATQTLTLSAFAAVTQPLTSYSIYVNTMTGSATSSVLGIDIDYIPGL